MESTKIHERLRAAREAKDWTTRQLDEAAVVSLGYTWRVERGDRPHIRNETLAKYATALGVSFEWLAFGKGRGPRVHRTAA